MTSAGLIRSARRRNTSSRSVVRSAPDSSSASISSSSEPPAALMTRRSACLELPELPEPEPPSSAAASCSLIAGIITERAGLWRPDIGPSSDFDDNPDLSEDDVLGRHAGKRREIGMRLQVPPLAVDRHEVAWPDHVEHVEQLAGRRVP